MTVRANWDVERIRALAAHELSTWVTADLHSRGQVAVAECIPVFNVPAHFARGEDFDKFVKALTWNGRWHVQVNRNNLPIGFARATETNAGLTIVGWSQDVLALQIAGALAKADNALSDDTHLLLLVESQPLAITVLLFLPRGEGKSFVIPVRVPRSMRKLRGELLDANVLLNQLRYLPVVRGLLNTQ